jgi:hypothetical protein
MFWVILIVGGFIGFIALLTMSSWILGGRLPEHHEASTQRRFVEPPDVLYARVTDLDGVVRWRPDLKAIERLPAIEGKPAWREIGRYGRMTLVAEERLPPTTVAPGRFVTRIVESSAPFGGRWTWEFAPDGAGGTTITLTENGTIKSRPMRAMAHHFMGLEATIRHVLAALARAEGAA